MEDIKGYIGALLLIGAQPGSRDIPYYWNTKDEQPDWPVVKYIYMYRFQQISRYLKVNKPGDLSDEQ